MVPWRARDNIIVIECWRRSAALASGATWWSCRTSIALGRCLEPQVVVFRPVFAQRSHLDRAVGWVWPDIGIMLQGLEYWLRFISVEAYLGPWDLHLLKNQNKRPKRPGAIRRRPWILWPRSPPFAGGGAWPPSTGASPLLLPIPAYSRLLLFLSPSPLPSPPSALPLSPAPRPSLQTILQRPQTPCSVLPVVKTQSPVFSFFHFYFFNFLNFSTKRLFYKIKLTQVARSGRGFFAEIATPSMAWAALE